MPESPSTLRPVTRRGDAARETLFQRIDAIVGSIRPAHAAAKAEVPSASATAPAPVPPALAGASLASATLTDANVAHRHSSPTEADPVFGRLLERWFALERDRVLGEHLHLDQVKAVAGAYAAEETALRVVR